MNQLAPKIKINKVNLAVDKKKTFLTITGGVFPWILNSVESILQPYLIDYFIKELESALSASFGHDSRPTCENNSDVETNHNKKGIGSLLRQVYTVPLTVERYLKFKWCKLSR